MPMQTMTDRAPLDCLPMDPIVHVCPRCDTTHPLECETPVRDNAALAQLRTKLADLGERIDDMFEDEYAGWLKALPYAEFLEFIVLEEPCATALMGQPSKRTAAPSAPGEST